MCSGSFGNIWLTKISGFAVCAFGPVLESPLCSSVPVKFCVEFLVRILAFAVLVHASRFAKILGL